MFSPRHALLAEMARNAKLAIKIHIQKKKPALHENNRLLPARVSAYIANFAAG